MRRSPILFALAAMFSLGAPAPLHAGAFDMDALWPNEDGRSWTYAQHSEQYGLPPSITDRVLRMTFDGTTVAPDGNSVQMIRGQLLSGPPTTDPLAAHIADPLLRSIHAARPDLRAAIEARAEGAACEVFRVAGFDGLLLTAETTYQKTADAILAWRCNATNTRSWQWLIADLTLGNTFTLQLLPDLTDDVFLHGTISAEEGVVVPAGMFASCLRVDYLIDYGVFLCTDASGNPVGTSRSETRGSVHYAANIGPVASEEAFFLNVEGTGTCPQPVPAGEAASRVTMKLLTIPVAVAPASWGQIKSRYR